MVFVMAALLTVAGIFLLRLSGRKSISEMTFGTVVVMLSLGTLLAQPLSQKDPWITLGTVATILATLVVLEWVQVKSNKLETLISGKSITVIEDGKLQEQNLRRVRVTFDKLEMRLREKGIARISDINFATIEANGDLGYELKPDAQPLTMGEFQTVMRSLFTKLEAGTTPGSFPEPSTHDGQGEPRPSLTRQPIEMMDTSRRIPYGEVDGEKIH